MRKGLGGGWVEGGSYSIHSTFRPTLSTFVDMATESPIGAKISAISISDRSVTTAIEGPTELIPTKSSPASRRRLICW